MLWFPDWFCAYVAVVITNYWHIYVFQAFAQLLQAPHDDTQMIIRERFPVPRLVVCDQHGSQVGIACICVLA